MSVYFVEKKGWRIDFTRKGIRYTKAWFKTKKEALRAEARQREEIERPTKVTQTDMGFLELVNLRLDHVKAYNSERHYQEYLYMARRWMRNWEDLTCSELSTAEIEKFVLTRSKVSNYVANKELRYLRATFNFGINKGIIITHNPVCGIYFLPVEKRIKYIPPMKDIDKVIALASKDTQDYLWTIRETLGRVSEINVSGN